jgi:hypothetical protein
MENPNIKTEVKHSESKDAWNVIGISLGGKYKIARIPYVVTKDSIMLTTIERYEALKHAKFISHCFNNSDKILLKNN